MIAAKASIMAWNKEKAWLVYGIGKHSARLENRKIAGIENRLVDRSTQVPGYKRL